tara:strand:- start:726 stop:1127 length:402 start_codon:yes stop_codon:yes gene_type:complete
MKILNFNAIEIFQILSSIFFVIVFFQSGIDKFIDRKGNINFFENHFKNTLFHKIHSHALIVLMLLELIAASLCAYGCIYSIVYKNTGFIFYGLLVTSFVLLSLLLGQRIAKDYAGAADITIYFILCVITIMSF